MQVRRSHPTLSPYLGELTEVGHLHCAKYESFKDGTLKDRHTESGRSQRQKRSCRNSMEVQMHLALIWEALLCGCVLRVVVAQTEPFPEACP
jgi:hypothetical protein